MNLADGLQKSPPHSPLILTPTSARASARPLCSLAGGHSRPPTLRAPMTRSWSGQAAVTNLSGAQASLEHKPSLISVQRLSGCWQGWRPRVWTGVRQERDCGGQGAGGGKWSFFTLHALGTPGPHAPPHPLPPLCVKSDACHASYHEGMIVEPTVEAWVLGMVIKWQKLPFQEE